MSYNPLQFIEYTFTQIPIIDIYHQESSLYPHQPLKSLKPLSSSSMLYIMKHNLLW